MHTWTFPEERTQTFPAPLSITTASGVKFLCVCMYAFQPSPWKGQGSALPISFDWWLFAV